MKNKSESYQFPFHFDQTLWAATFLLRKIGKDVPCLDLARLLYIAERDHLSEVGEMFMGGTIHALQSGPVLRTAYKLIKGNDVHNSDEWARHIRFLPKTHCVRLIHFPENFRLWREQVGYLYDALDLYRGDKKVDIDKLVQSFPEWKKCKPTRAGKYRIIPWEEILKARGREDLLEQANRCFEIRQVVEDTFRKLRQQPNTPTETNEDP